MPVTRICLALVCLAVLAAPARAADDPVLAALGRAGLTLQIAPQQESAWRARLPPRDAGGRRAAEGKHPQARADRVLNIIRGMAARGVLSADLMPMAFLTLQRNADWWATHGPPTSGGSPGEKGAVGRNASRCGSPKEAQGPRRPPHLPRQRRRLPVVSGHGPAGPGQRHVCRHQHAVRREHAGVQGAGARGAGRDAHDRAAARRRDPWDYLFPFGGAAAAVDERALAGHGDPRLPQGQPLLDRAARSPRSSAYGRRWASASHSAPTATGTRCTPSRPARACSTRTSTRSSRCTTWRA